MIDKKKQNFFFRFVSYLFNCQGNVEEKETLTSIIKLRSCAISTFTVGILNTKEFAFVPIHTKRLQLVDSTRSNVRN